MDPTKSENGKIYHQYQDRAPPRRRNIAKQHISFLGKKVTANPIHGQEEGREQKIFNKIFSNRDDF